MHFFGAGWEIPKPTLKTLVIPLLSLWKQLRLERLREEERISLSLSQLQRMTPFKDISSWGPYPMVWLRWGMKDRPFLDNSEGCESPKVPCGIGWGCPWAPHLPYSFPVQLLPSLPVTGIHLTNPSYESTYILNCVSELAFGKSRPWAEWIGTSFSPKPSQWVFQGIPAEFDLCLPGLGNKTDSGPSWWKWRTRGGSIEREAGKQRRGIVLHWEWVVLCWGDKTRERQTSNAFRAMRSCKQQARDGEYDSTQCQLQVVDSESLHIIVERRVLDCVWF